MSESQKKVLLPVLVLVILAAVGFAIYSATSGAGGIKEEAVQYKKQPPPDSAPLDGGTTGAADTTEQGRM